MQKGYIKNILLLLSTGLFSNPVPAAAQLNQAPLLSGWKAGVAIANITPGESMWMGGFGFRKKPSEGVTTDIWAKALALEDAKGRRAVFISVETSNLEKEIYEPILARLKEAYLLTNEQVIINSSHTHSGAATNTIYYTKDEKEREKIRKYISKLEDQVVEITGKALGALQPVKLYSGNGVSRFQVNRRNNVQYKLRLQQKFNGPNDYAVPVIKVEKLSGELLAVLFGYACHASILRDYKISGDYPSFAQMELEKLYPGVTAIFFQGAGGNQIGYPRNTVEAARQWGKTLAASVERVLSEPMNELTASLSTSFSVINLESDLAAPSLEELVHIVSTASYPESLKNKAKADLEKLNRGESLIATYPYPVQVWKIGNLPVITLGEEDVVEYAINLKLIFGQDAFVFGYSNYSLEYMGTPLIWNEGGYEGNSAPFGIEGVRLSLNSESMIIQEVLKLAKQVGVEMATKMYSIPGG